MKTTQLFTATLVFATIFFGIGLHVSAQDAESLRAILNAPAASRINKIVACKQAALRGDAAAVPVLAEFLLDEQLSHPARIALQQIAGTAAGDALREAASHANGAILIGIVNTLGERAENESVTVIAPLLSVPQLDVVYAASVALGKIGGNDAVRSLNEAYSQAKSVEHKTKFIDGFYGCAERFVRDGHSEDAIPIYSNIAGANELPSTSRSGAVRGWITAQHAIDAGNTGALQQFIESDDDVLFLAAIEASQTLVGSDITRVLVARLAASSPDRQVVILDALQQRGDNAAQETVLQYTQNGDAKVKLAAIAALSSMPNDNVVDALFAQLESTSPEVVEAAIESLSRMKFAELNARVAAKLQDAKTGAGVLAYAKVCQLRRIADATPALLQHIAHPEEAVRNGVVSALGYTVSGEDVGVLVDLLVSAESDAAWETVRKALHVLATRTVDKDQVATKIAAVYDSVPLKTQCAILELLGAIGGNVAVQAVDKAVDDPTDAIQDTATRVLGEWPDPDAAPVLLGVIKREGGSAKYKVRALRGYIRIFRQMDTSNEHRFNMSMEAWNVASRDDEKRLIIDAMGRLPIPQSLQKLCEFLDAGLYSEEVCTSLVNAAEPLVTQHRDLVVSSMQKVISTTTNDDLKRRASEAIQQAQK
ncbi:MAG: HEAT repeat domain-containing protein [Thermoguttaceae bacterium]